MRNLFVIQSDLVLAIHLFHRHIRQHIVLRRSRKDLARTRIQPPNIVGRLLHVLYADPHPTRDFGKTPPAQILHVFGHDFVLQAILFSFSPQLNEQTLAQIARANSWRMKTLYQRQHFFEIFLGIPEFSAISSGALWRNPLSSMLPTISSAALRSLALRAV